MTRALHGLLILLMLVTGLSLGAARGQARVAGELVLCAGTSFVTVAVDADGNPVERVMVCPDMALSLLAGMIAPPPFLPAPEGAARRLLPPPGVPISASLPPVPRARDPPHGRTA